MTSPADLAVVGTGNHVKVMAARDAFDLRGIPAWVRAEPVPSGVPEQPLTVADARAGAENRARAALERAPDARWAVGSEGGIALHGTDRASCLEHGWICVLDRGGRAGWATTVGMPVPPVIVDRILDHGEDLDQAVAHVLGVLDAGRHAGFNGIVTDGHIVRRRAYADAVLVALAPWSVPNLWDPR